MVYVHLATGYEEIEALTTVDILRRAGVEVQLVSVEDCLTVESTHGIRVEADITFTQADYDRCSMIVLPGGMPGAVNLEAHEGLMNQVCRKADEGGWIAAICASPAVVLAPHGILAGKKATVYPGMEDELLKYDAVPVTDGVVRDGNIITGKGPAYAAEFALAVLEALEGRSKADEIAEDFLIER